MAYSTIDKSSSFMDTKLYTGTGSSNAITGVGFQPDFTWIKKRTTANSILTDAVRGATKYLISNEADIEATAAETLKSFDADGFTVGTSGDVNANAGTYVGWNWKAGGAGSSNTDGSTTATVSVNATSKFSIVKYVGTGSSATVGHGLGVAPDWILMKNMTDSNNWWWISHKSLDAPEKSLHLNVTNAVGTNSSGITARSTNTFTVVTDSGTNKSGSNYIAYCFANVPGYSKFGDYIGNGSTTYADCPFVYTGFKPSVVIIKNKTTAANWEMFDNKRIVAGYNAEIHPSASAGESVPPGDRRILFVSNGFKIETSTTGAMNTTGDKYVYMAWGQPIVGTNNTPATAT